jgi:DNA-binding Lrp family transcriptional regulator
MFRPGMAPSDLARIRDLLRALRRGPLTVQEIADELGIPALAVFKLVRELEDAGIEVERIEIETEAKGPKPTGLRVTVTALRDWLG